MLPCFGSKDFARRTGVWVLLKVSVYMSPELACWRSGLLALQISLLYFQLPSLHWSFWFYPPRKTYTAETLALSVQRFRQGLVSITVADVWATVGVLDLIEIASISLLKMQGKTSWANRSFTHQVSEFKLSLLDRWLSMVVFIWNLEKKKPTTQPQPRIHHDALLMTCYT